MTMSQQRLVLDPLTLSLTGQHLIEASAGTGKTYTITLLYLRALLGVGRARLDTDQILVVTFTEAATAELRDRIRRRIVDARKLFLTGSCDDPALFALLDRVDMSHEAAAILLENAARKMDEASIHTIHGFCQRMLNQNAFESGTLFSSEFIMDQSLLLERAVNDFWRTNFYPLGTALAVEVKRYWKMPTALLREISGVLAMENLHLQPLVKDQDLERLHREFQQQIIAFKSAWLQQVADLQPLIAGSTINKRSYSKSTLPKWLDSVTAWAQGNDSSVAENLYRFSQSELMAKTPTGEPPCHALFEAAQTLLDEQPAYRQIILARAVTQVRENLAEQKQQRALISPDDLIALLAKALTGPMSAILATRIRELYPLALIDEFQDTDPLQYRIFNTIYSDAQGHDSGRDENSDQGMDAANDQTLEGSEESADPHALLMIGDPKQAIYGFRGADIFTYIGARSAIADHHSLDTNWRSSKAMVNGVNSLFRFSRSPFIYNNDITFDAVKASSRADDAPLMVNAKPVSGLKLWLHPEADAIVDKATMQSTFARATALEITELLQAAYQGEAVIADAQPRALRPADIAVLVRDRMEAQVIRQALAEQHIDAVFLSRDSVFETPIAMDLYRVLVAVSDPTNERRLNAALATSMLGYSAAQLDQFTRDEHQWEGLLNLFLKARERWRKLGVLPMLRYLMRDLAIAESIVARDEGERLLTDLLHLGELLQQSSLELDGEHGLLRWYAQQLIGANNSADDQQLRLESDRELVKIVTIHRSKGLEYGVVFLPFVCRYRKAKKALYHADGNTVWDLDSSADAQESAEKERLAEDLRLLYVALTRSIHCCYLGVANIKEDGNSRASALRNTALGYLLNSHDDSNLEDTGLSHQLERLQQLSRDWYDDITLQVIPPPLAPIAPLQVLDKQAPELSSKVFSGQVSRDWRMGSYSGLVAQQSHARIDLPGVDIELQAELDETASQKPNASVEELTAFNFPRGAYAGTFLHSLFEELSFPEVSVAMLEPMVRRQLNRDGFDDKWLPTVMAWIVAVLESPLPEKTASQPPLRLKDIDDQHKRVEMEFVLPVARLRASDLNPLLQRYGLLASMTELPALDFRTLKGMLKGFIDLIFEHQGQYFVLDYKSNHLGDSVQDYTQSAMQNAMISHRYDLQYVIYTLALHRYLKNRLPDYDYDQHIGGCYYLFLRGMSAGDGQYGVFFDKPCVELIQALDNLLKEENLD